MIKFVSVTEMREIEKEADQRGISYTQMMTSAGEELARVIDSEFSSVKNRGALGLIGPGNNGGDTLVALTRLAETGWITSAFLMTHRANNDPLIVRFQQAGGTIFIQQPGQEGNTLQRLILTHSVLIDGLLGTGIRLPLKSEAATLLSSIKKIILKDNPSIKIVAVDCPSGIDCDTGEAAPETIPAHLTVTMAAIKHGLLKFPAYALTGRLQVVDIGLSDHCAELDAWNVVKTFVPDQAYIHEYLPERSLDSHKGTFGTTLVSAGCTLYPGAAFLSGKSAYLIGTGLVTMAVPNTVYAILAGNFPEATWLPLPEEGGFVAAEAAEIILPTLSRASALLIGPGFGLQKTSQEYIARLFTRFIPSRSENGLSSIPPIIIDADALKLISQFDRWWEILPEKSILTPHPGEMAILTGLEKGEIQNNRLKVAQKYSSIWGHVVVLKGAFTVVANPDGLSAIIPVATPALARAGTGDVLAGLIAGLRAQGVAAFHAAVVGVWIHAQAGIKAANILGNTSSVLASDVLNAIPSVVSEVDER